MLYYSSILFIALGAAFLLIAYSNQAGFKRTVLGILGCITFIQASLFCLFASRNDRFIFLPCSIFVLYLLSALLCIRAFRAYKRTKNYSNRRSDSTGLRIKEGQRR